MRLKEDSSSWKSRGIVRRNFRQDPGTPESEIPKYRAYKKTKPKHVHDWKEIILIDTPIDASLPWYRRRYVASRRYVCQTCGNSRGYRPFR